VSIAAHPDHFRKRALVWSRRGQQLGRGSGPLAPRFHRGANRRLLNSVPDGSVRERLRRFLHQAICTGRISAQSQRERRTRQAARRFALAQGRGRKRIRIVESLCNIRQLAAKRDSRGSLVKLLSLLPFTALVRRARLEFQRKILRRLSFEPLNFFFVRFCTVGLSPPPKATSRQRACSTGP